MQAKYPLKIQAIRSKNQQARLYVYFPLPLAAAIGLEAGEEVQWELLDRGDYTWCETKCLKSMPAKGAPKPPKFLRRPKNRLLKANVGLRPTEVAPDRRVSEH
jgi:hypothetical protein